MRDSQVFTLLFSLRYGEDMRLGLFLTCIFSNFLLKKQKNITFVGMFKCVEECCEYFEKQNCSFIIEWNFFSFLRTNKIL